MEEISTFREFGEASRKIVTEAKSFGGKPVCVPTFVNEFWTSKQRAASSLHEISYRACCKPQLPRFFIERLTKAGEVVYDPFMGRGTTLVEAALLARIPIDDRMLRKTFASTPCSGVRQCRVRIRLSRLLTTDAP